MTLSNGGKNDFGNDINAAAPEERQAGCRGFFIIRNKVSFKNILDGLSNTVAAGEIATDLGDNAVITRAAKSTTGDVNAAGGVTSCDSYIDPQRPQFWLSTATFANPGPTGGIEEEGRGYKWAQCRSIWGQCTTIAPPNSPLCASTSNFGDMILPPSSRHQGGVHVLMGDGAVKFVTDSIEAGNQDSAAVGVGATYLPAGSQSPYGLWGALGTRANKETVGEF